MLAFGSRLVLSTPDLFALDFVGVATFCDVEGLQVDRGLLSTVRFTGVQCVHDSSQ